MIPYDFSPDVTVIKLTFDGREAWRYAGRILERQDNCLVLEAYFDRPDMLFHGMPFRRGDRFIETYYNDRWYNVFEIHAREDDSLRGWYCNITYPARIEDISISYIDLALDLLVFPDGRQLVLDENEYQELHLPPEKDRHARNALEQLQSEFNQKIQGQA